MLKYRARVNPSILSDNFVSQTSIPSSFVSQDSGNVSSDTIQSQCTVAVPFPRNRRLTVSKISRPRLSNRLVDFKLETDL